VIVDPSPSQPNGDDPVRAAEGSAPYSLPSPLQHRDRLLPVAPTAPRFPSALRAFNGMPPAEPSIPAEPRGRDGLSIRDLLLDSPPVEEGGVFAGIRSVWDRFRQGRRRDDPED
jgi:hypothetical protein